MRRAGGVRSDDEFSVFLHHHAIDFEPAAEAEVADEVGVDGGFVYAARLGVAGADRQVDGAANLLVEQDLAGAAFGPVVVADPEPAEAGGAGVGVERFQQVLPAALGVGIDDHTGLEAQANAGDLAATYHRRQVEADLALDRVLDRAREELAVGHVVAAVAGDELAAGDAEPDVGPGRRHSYLLVAFDPLRQPLRLLRGPLPGAERIAVGGQASAVVEVFVVGQAHLRLGGVGAGGVEREAPAEIALGAALHRPRHQVAGDRLAQGLALGRDPAELTRVGAGPDRDPHVGVVDHPLGEGRDPFQLGVGGVLEVGGDLAVEGDVEDRVGARLQHLLVDRQQQRRSGALAVDRDDLARLDLG